MDRANALAKAVKKGVQKLDRVRDDGLRWKSKYAAEKEEVRLREERIVAGALEMRELGRSWKSADKRNADLVGSCEQNWHWRGDKLRSVLFACLSLLN
jgi:hypothetical protein